VEAFFLAVNYGEENAPHHWCGGLTPLVRRANTNGAEH